jgi:hypothetical protein
MRGTYRWGCARAVVGLCVTFGLSGCSREAPSEPKKVPVPKIPGGPSEKRPAPAAGRSASQPVSTIRPPGTSRPATLPGPLSVAISVAKPTPVSPPAGAPTPAPSFSRGAADGQDAIDASPFLPKSGTIPNWAKAEPIRTAPAGELATIMPPEAAKVADPYQIKRACACAYRLTSPGGAEVFRILLIETYQPEDAYGLFTVNGKGEISQEPGLLMATDSSSRRIAIHVWKGRHYLELYGPASGEPGDMDACKALVRKITFQMPDASPPELIEALPRPGLMPGQQWLIRGWASLAGPRTAGLNLADARQIGENLGLNKDTQMVIAAYKVAGGARPNLVWVVRYDSPGEARKAYDRYQAFLDKAADRQSASTMLLRPSGTYLLGTWTAEEESLEPVLDKLKSNLG